MNVGASDLRREAIASGSTGMDRADPRPSPALPATAAAAFLVLSGAAALIYQVVWVRLLNLSIGATSVAVSIVLAAFFMGLAGGSL